MFYLSLRSSFICKGNVFYPLYSIISIHTSTFQISFPPFIHKSVPIFPSSSLYALSSTVYHNFHAQLFPKRSILRSNSHPSITKHVPITFNFSILSKLSQLPIFPPSSPVHSFINCNERRRQRRKRRVNSVS